eukprot:5684097-Pyramimonas_sp.AAC.1
MMILFHDLGSVACDLPNGTCKNRSQDPIADECCSFWCCPDRERILEVPGDLDYPMSPSELDSRILWYQSMQCSPGEHQTACAHRICCRHFNIFDVFCRAQNTSRPSARASHVVCLVVHSARGQVTAVSFPPFFPFESFEAVGVSVTMLGGCM